MAALEKMENDFLKVEIALHGAELQSIYHKKQDREYLWQGSPDWWPRRAPVLFPIVGKLNNNQYRVNGTVFSLPQHGFARDNEFTCSKRTENSIEFVLEANQDLLQKYPFLFELKIRYTLEGLQLYVQYEVKNTNAGVMYFSIGAHPGLLLRMGEALSDYYIEFEKTETLDRHLLENGLLSGETERIMTQDRILPLHNDLFTKDAIVLKNMRSSFLYLKGKKSDYRVKLSCNGFPYFGIWSKPGAPFLCLEPWYGIADHVRFEGEFKNKEGIKSLGSAKTFQCSFSIEI